MKPWHVFHAALLLSLAAPVARAQTAPPPPSPIARTDVSVMLGWFNADKSDTARDSYNEWYNSSLYGGLGAGWYWTDNHKTEIDFGATSEGDIYTSRPAVIDGQPTYIASRLFFDTKRVAVSQQYQGYRNAWFHPHVAAGVDLTWETTREERFPTIFYDNVTRTPRQILPPQNRGPETDLVVRPFAAVGFKAYMTERAFFRSDLRFTVKHGIEEVLWRVGFGVDF